MDYIKGYFLVSFILIFISYIAPNESYRKYMKYFVGILMSVMILKTILQIVNFEVDNSYIARWKVFEQEIDDYQYENGEVGWFEDFLREKAEKD